MVKRDRDILKKFYVDEEENEKIKLKMEEVGTINFSGYARQMVLKGEIKKIDFKFLRTVHYEIAKIGNNINQIVRLSHEKGQVDSIALEKILDKQDELSETIRKLVQFELKKAMR